MPRSVCLFVCIAALLLCPTFVLSQQYKNGAKPMLYRISDVGETASVAMDVNDRLQIAGNLYSAPNQPSAFFRETDGSVKAIPSGSPTMRTYARKISNWGQVTGYIYGDLPARAFRWSAASGTETLAFGDQSFGYGVNGLGDCVGLVILDGKERAFYWDHFGNAAQIGTIDTSPLARTAAYAINDAQQVVGFAVGADGVARAFVWSPGAPMKILLPQYENSIAYAISDTGRITGTVQTKTGWRVFIYDTRTRIVEMYGPHNVDSTAYGIEYSGVAVGQSDDKAAMFLSLRAFDLNDFVDGGTPWKLTNANAINSRGEIVVSGTLNGVTRAFLLTPLF